jgi:hypothetical protein
VTARRLIPAALSVALAVCSCRARPAPEQKAPSAPSPADRLSTIAASCALVASCAHAHDAPDWRSPGACVDAWLAREGDPDDGLPRCLSSARTCDGVRACLHPSGRPDAHPARFCRAHPGAMTACEGDALIACSLDDPDESTSIDCVSLGARCGDLVQPGGLSTHACVDAARCPAEVTKAWCARRDELVLCHDGEIERTECKAGTICREHTDRDGELAASCDGPGHVACDTPGKRRCDGDALITCEAHGHFGHESVVDCARVGLACGVTTAGATCRSKAPRCERGHPACDGGDLVFCAAGVPVRVACAAIGLGACEADGRGPDAMCHPPAEVR